MRRWPIFLIALLLSSVGCTKIDTFIDTNDSDTSDLSKLEMRMTFVEDASEECKPHPGTVNIGSTDLEFFFDSYSGINCDQMIGIRFRNLSLPPGAIVSSAYIQFTSDGSSDTTTNIVISGEHVGNSELFEEVDGNLSSREQTEVAVNWSDVPAWEDGMAGEEQRTPDISSIVQGIIEHPEWATGNALSFFFNGTGLRRAFSYSGDESVVPVLNIYWKE